MRKTVSTYRLQLGPALDFRAAAALVPYLDELGVTDLYLSPPFAAAPGSTHGYDVVDHNRLNPALGGDEGFDELAQATARHHMGILLDFVPNHMGIGPANPWWMDVLENGPSSLYAPYFDVDWHPIKPELAYKVLVPLLGDQYGEVLERGELRLERDGGVFQIAYYEHRFPVAPRAVPRIIGHRLERLREELGPSDVHLQELESIITALEKLAPREEVSPESVAERAREKEVAKRRLAALFGEAPRIAAFVDDNLAIFNGGRRDDGSCGGARPDARCFDLLDELLSHQAYRLAYWRVAGEEINYRRFFDVNSLAAIRMEDERVFNDTHQLVFRLLAEGKVAGLRIDHPDGLYAPSDYFARLQAAHPGLYVVVEKILGGREHMPSTWQVAGTTGYEFLNAVNGLFVDARHAAASDAFYARFTGVRREVAALVHEHKRALMRASMASEIYMLSHRLNRLSEANRRTRDFTLAALTGALVEFVARLPVYRTYVEGGDAGAIEPRDRQYIETTLTAARRASRHLGRSLFDWLRGLLLLEAPTPESREFVGKLQQLTGPVTAKAIEDTVFYIYNRLVSLNEVGGDPAQFGISRERFHALNAERLRDWPGSLNATATHDTKRGEDTRLRIDALSEVPAEWEARVVRWAELARPFKRDLDGEPAPDANDELLLYQTLVGTFPDDERVSDDYRARLGAYLEKAIREAKTHTSWTNPDEGYEQAMRELADALLSSPPFLNDLVPFVRRVAHAARLSSLSQVALKAAVPGVTDVYQGCELWDLSLVDPDNRRPVDFAARRRLLATLAARLEAGERRRLARELVMPAALVDGRAKLLLVREALRLRRAHPELMLAGDYLPLEAAGDQAEHVVAFARRHGDERLVCVAPRLWLQLLGSSTTVRWRGQVRLVAGLGDRFEHVVTGARVESSDGTLDLGTLFADFPVALLYGRAR